MQTVFLLWPLLLLPALAAWLTRAAAAPAAKKKTSEKKTSMPAIQTASPRRTATQAPAYSPEAHAIYLEMRMAAANERRRASLAYRQAAHAAYQAMQNMQEEELPTGRNRA